MDTLDVVEEKQPWSCEFHVRDCSIDSVRKEIHNSVIYSMQNNEPKITKSTMLSASPSDEILECVFPSVDIVCHAFALGRLSIRADNIEAQMFSPELCNCTCWISAEFNARTALP